MWATTTFFFWKNNRSSPLINWLIFLTRLDFGGEEWSRVSWPWLWEVREWVEIKEGQVGLVAKRTVVYSEGEKGVNCLCQGYLVSPHSKTVLLGNLKI